MLTPTSTPVPLPPIPTDPQTVHKLTAEQWKAVLDAPPADATRWVTAAARQGHPGSQLLLGQWLLDGRGTDRKPHDAFAWFLKAAQQGEAMAMNMAGRCYENGWGVEPDLQAAIRWYRNAANKGLDAGLYNLANQLASGQGMPRDDAQALALYTRAAGLGHAKSMTKSGRFHEDGLTVAARCGQGDGLLSPWRGRRRFSGAVRLCAHAGRTRRRGAVAAVAAPRAAHRDAGFPG